MATRRRTIRAAPGQVAPQVPTDETLARERRVLELRRAGVSFDQIASTVGYTARGAAHKAFMRALSRTLVQPAQELRDLEADRLDRMQVQVWERALRGDDKAILTVLRIMERRARLLGLDHADGLAEKALAMTEEAGRRQIAEMQTFLTNLGLDGDVRARAEAAAYFGRLRIALELESGELIDVDPDLPPPAKRRAAKAPAKAPARRQRVTATRLDKENLT
jgi:hypothetical protein